MLRGRCRKHLNASGRQYARSEGDRELSAGHEGPQHIQNHSNVDDFLKQCALDRREVSIAATAIATIESAMPA